jgi:DNA adenine methylase
MLKPIFPYFGGKRRAASEVWDALGTVDRYIEPFFGSGAVLLGNPNPAKSELVNDINHHVANLWRALQHEPEEVWRLASAPCSEVELKSRAAWLKAWKPYDFGDVDAYDAKAAGFWLFVTCTDIARGDGQLQRNGMPRGIKAHGFNTQWQADIVERIKRVEVLCGDWSRCVTHATMGLGLKRDIGIFLDPPYGTGDVPYDDNTGNVSKDVWEWSIENGNNPRIRIVVAGYDDGRKLPEGWGIIERSEQGGYGARKTKTMTITN